MDGSLPSLDSRRAYMGYGMAPSLDGREIYMYYLGTNEPHPPR